MKSVGWFVDPAWLICTAYSAELCKLIVTFHRSKHHNASCSTTISNNIYKMIIMNIRKLLILALVTVPVNINNVYKRMFGRHNNTWCLGFTSGWLVIFDMQISNSIFLIPSNQHQSNSHRVLTIDRIVATTSFTAQGAAMIS